MHGHAAGFAPARQCSNVSTNHQLGVCCCFVSVCDGEADVVFVLDASGSLDEPNFNHIKNFVSNLTNELDVDSGKIRVGVVTYSDRAEPRFNLSRYNNRYIARSLSCRLSNVASLMLKLHYFDLLQISGGFIVQLVVDLLSTCLTSTANQRNIPVTP